MLLGLLLTLNIIVCLALIGVVLLQRSEGGALGGGSPSGLITTRGAGDLLTRTTWILFSVFLTISLALTLLGGRERSSQAILNRLKLQSINPDAVLPSRAQHPTGAPGQAPPPTVHLTGSQTPDGAGATQPASGRRDLSAPIPSVNLAPLTAAGTKAPVNTPAL